jgi:hypothetical protein
LLGALEEDLYFNIILGLSIESVLSRRVENHYSGMLEKVVEVGEIWFEAFYSEVAVTLVVKCDKVVAQVNPRSSDSAEGQVDINIKHNWGKSIKKRNIYGRLLEITNGAKVTPVITSTCVVNCHVVSVEAAHSRSFLNKELAFIWQLFISWDFFFIFLSLTLASITFSLFIFWGC